MDELEGNLRRYYEQESGERQSREIDHERVRRRALFADLLTAESRSTLIEVGCGPGRDAREFRAHNIETFGVDLSHASLRLASANGTPAAQASLFALPFPERTFEAGWTMSTLLHVPDIRFDEAVGSLLQCLRPGAPLAIGLWGGVDREQLADFDTIDPPRFFSLRSHDRLRSMFSTHGTIERFDTWPGAIDWEYQFVVLRTP